MAALLSALISWARNTRIESQANELGSSGNPPETPPGTSETVGIKCEN